MVSLCLKVLNADKNVKYIINKKKHVTHVHIKSRKTWATHNQIIYKKGLQQVFPQNYAFAWV